MRCVDACPVGALEVVNEVQAGQRQETPYVPLCTLDRGPGVHLH